MLIARVVGTAISTIKDEKIKGNKLLILKQTDHTGKAIGKAYVAVDLVDAGVGELVLSGHGSSARQTFLTKDCPIDAVVMAVIDHLNVDGQVVFRKE
ncbi:MAG: EutN/CcmL family microcompartment protein [Chloroflexota bacterium]